MAAPLGPSYVSYFLLWYVLMWSKTRNFEYFNAIRRHLKT